MEPGERDEARQAAAAALVRDGEEDTDGAALPEGAHCTILVVASGAGSPGRTTVAIGVAGLLGTAKPTVLVEADLAGPCAAALLDLDPRRNLYMLETHDAPQTARQWRDALAQETQPLHPGSPHGVVLCGIPKVTRRGGVSDRFLSRTLAALARHQSSIVIDVGAELLAGELSLHRTALGLADEVLLVGESTFTELHRLKEALRLVTSLGVATERVHLVLNRYHRRYHEPLEQIERALGRPLAAVIPFDPDGVERALAAQHPLTAERRSPAARALLDLATRIYGGKLAPPAASVTRRNAPRPLGQRGGGGESPPSVGDNLSHDTHDQMGQPDATGAARRWRAPWRHGRLRAAVRGAANGARRRMQRASGRMPWWR